MHTRRINWKKLAIYVPLIVLLILTTFQFHLNFRGGAAILNIRWEVSLSYPDNLALFGISYVLLKLAIFSVCYFWLYPRFMRQRKYGLWLLWAVIIWLGATLVRYLVEQVISPALFNYSNYPSDYNKIEYNIDNFYWLIPWVVAGTVIPFIEDWFRMKRDRQQLEIQRTKAELALLKSQLNPHFLFNTLNSIYSLAYQQSPKAPDAILKLSEVMRYVLYDSEGRLVPLEKELQYLHSFVDLQKARFKETIYVDLLVSGSVTTQQIVPVLLIAFVENAFKHGELYDPKDPVLIQVNVDGQRLHLIVQNRISNTLKDQAGGIGLPNIRRRLELMYEGKYQLDIRNTPTHYICELELDLSASQANHQSAAR
ncbi:sensor histidine kinase [Chitinophaga barathri]|uniref:Signal transduction histidine kinase internal region domain-containing protein n=1 Tax=Chitinophaga barathri TaxID=1647451 RepID=A0A3N4M629_9BACT|nr:histidine kinase [Chitinophaga barathri]RPD38742.1 hypothetical protein EG028_23845 [Chitinophaga barathri]